MESARNLVDKVAYTASLVTRPDDIADLRDEFSEVTARIDLSAPLGAADRAQLLHIQERLESYLATREPLRSFTADSLQVQIEQHVQGGTTKNARVQLWLVIVIAALTAVGAALLPGLSDVQQRVLVGGATMFSLLTVGAASLFLTALASFKSGLRKAFVLICTGVILLGLSLLGQPIMEVFTLRGYPLTSILYTLPILIAAIIFHAGDAWFVRLVGVKTVWATAAPVILASIGVAMITIFIPHNPSHEPEIIYDLVAAMWGAMLVTPVASAIILPKAVHALPDLYKPPVRYLNQAMYPIIAVVAYQYVVRVVAGPYMEGPVAYVLFGLVTLMGIALLRAAYSFNKVSRY